MTKSYDNRTRLPFRTHRITALGRSVEEYRIPPAMKGVVLERLYPFKPVPKLGEMRYDLHEERLFQVRDFRVIRDMGMNWLVSPYYSSSGGMVIDWAPPDWAEGGANYAIRELTREPEGDGGTYLVTGQFEPGE